MVLMLYDGIPLQRFRILKPHMQHDWNLAGYCCQNTNPFGQFSDEGLS